MAYAEWIDITIQISSAIGAVGIRNAQLQWGKFYRINKDDEMSIDEVNRMDISPGGTGGVRSCGRESASSGTQGSFDLFDGATKMGTFWWDDPWAPGTANTWGFNPASDTYVGGVSGGKPSGAEIGSVKLRMSKF